MKEREAAGGLGERQRPKTAAPGRRDSNAVKPKDNAAEEEKKAGKPKPAQDPKERPQTAKPTGKEEEKKIPPKNPAQATIGGKKPATNAAKDDGDADDPIAKSLAERVKAGTLTSAQVGGSCKAPTSAITKP